MLKTALKPLVRNKEISIWDDTQIKVGTEWREEIKAALAKAKVAVLLVSPSFLASDFIAKHELPPLLEAAKTDGLIILWIAIRTSMYQETELEHYQAANDPSKPLASLKTAQRDRELVDICTQIKLAVSTIASDEPIEVSVSEDPQLSEEVEELKKEYFKSLKIEYEYMDLGGISPRVGNKVVKIRMEDLFIPLRVMEEASLLESFPEEVPTKSPVSNGEPHIVVTEGAADISIENDASLSPQAESNETIMHMPSRPAGHNAIEIVHILEKSRVVALGHPGSGKTTIGKYIAYSIASASTNIGHFLAPFIPVIVKAADYASYLKENHESTFYDYIVQRHTIKYGELFRWALQSGRCFVIIDGLDEVPEPTVRVTTSRRIDKFVSEFASNRFLVTSRIVGYRQNQLSGDFAHVTLSDLTEEQIQQFLRQWYKAIESEAESQVSVEAIQQRASQLWIAIRSNPGIRKLAGNPLLLTIIALANWRGTKLPNRRVELYQIATETLIENWPLKQRGLSIDSEEILSILEPIAHHIFNSGKNNLITEYVLRPLFETQVCEMRGATPNEAKAISREILQTIEEHTGFFLLKGLDHRGQNIYGFLHLTFAEYLTARFLAEQWSSGQLLLAQYAHDARWHEVMLLMAGHIGTWATAQATQLVRDILQLRSPYEEYLYRDLLLAAEILSDNVRVKRELQDEIVSNLIEIALNTPYEPLLETCMTRLVNISKVFHLGHPAMVLQLQEGEEAERQMRKAILLTRLGQETDETNRVLLERLEQIDNYQDPIHSLVYSGSWSLFEDVKDGTYLLMMATKNFLSSFLTVEQTANKITRYVPEIYNQGTFRSNPESIEKQDIHLWLIDLRNLRLDAEEVKAWLTTSDWRLRFALTRALSESSRAISIFNDLLAQAVSGDNLEARVMALEAFEIIVTDSEITDDYPQSEWINLIKSLIDFNDDPRIRLKALNILFYLDVELPFWTSIIMRALNDPNETVRASAAKLSRRDLSKSSGPVIGKIWGLLKDDSRTVRQESALALIRSGMFEEKDIPVLLEQGFSQDTNTKEEVWQGGLQDSLLLLAQKATAASTFKMIGDTLKKIIENKFGDNTSRYYWHPNYNLRRSNPIRELTDSVSIFFNHPDADIRLRAIILWPYVRPTSVASEHLLPLLEDPDLKVRAEAFRVLTATELQQPEIIDLVIESVAHVDLEVASAATFALSKVVELDARQELISRLASLIKSNQGNKNIYRALWGLIGLPGGEMYDVPF